LADGVYDLTAHAALITAASGGQSLSGGDPTFTFHHLFGDSNGNGAVNALDYAQFKKRLGLTFAYT
jgi:hypothetical protein